MKYLALILLAFPLRGIAQTTSPVAWSWKAVIVDSNYFEFHLIADIFRGWWVYKPNKQEVCPYSPKVTFNGSSKVEPVGEVDVIEGFLCTNEDKPPFCPLPSYTSNV